MKSTDATNNPVLSEADAYVELRSYWPNSEIRIEQDKGLVKIWRGKTLITKRPNLVEAMARVRWYLSVIGFSAK